MITVSGCKLFSFKGSSRNFFHPWHVQHCTVVGWSYTFHSTISTGYSQNMMDYWSDVVWQILQYVLSRLLEQWFGL